MNIQAHTYMQYILSPVTTVLCAISSDIPGVQHGGLLPASQQQRGHSGVLLMGKHLRTHIPHLLYSILPPSLLHHLQHGSELKVSSTPVSDKVRPLISGQIPTGSPHLSLLVCRNSTSQWVSCHNLSLYLVPPEHSLAPVRGAGWYGK